MTYDRSIGSACATPRLSKAQPLIRTQERQAPYARVRSTVGNLQTGDGGLQGADGMMER